MFDEIDENFETGESTARECFMYFTDKVINAFGEDYLWNPTEADLWQILSEKAVGGFSGCIGSRNCQQWL